MMFPILFTLISFFTTKESLPVDSTEIDKTKLLQLVNDARKKGCKCGKTWYGPAPAVTWNDVLEKVATDHSNDMAKNGSLSHTSQGLDPGERIKKAGYNWKTYGENVAFGHSDERSVVEGWLKSPGHCENIMNKSHKEMGVARSGMYWTQVLASR